MFTKRELVTGKVVRSNLVGDDWIDDPSAPKRIRGYLLENATDGARQVYTSSPITDDSPLEVGDGIVTFVTASGKSVSLPWPPSPEDLAGFMELASVRAAVETGRLLVPQASPVGDDVVDLGELPPPGPGDTTELPPNRPANSSST